MNLYRAMRTGLALSVAAIGLTLAPTPADATMVDGQQCIETNTYTFQNALTLTSRSGFVTLSHSLQCLRENVNTSPVSESVFQTVASGSNPNYTYTGSCALAVISGPTVHLLIGGALVVAAGVSTQPGVGGKVIPVLPDKPCTDPAGSRVFTGTGINAGVAVTP